MRLPGRASGRGADKSAQSKLLVKTSDFRVAKFAQFEVFGTGYHAATKRCPLPAYQRYRRKRRNATPIGGTTGVRGFYQFLRTLYELYQLNSLYGSSMSRIESKF